MILKQNGTKTKTLNPIITSRKVVMIIRVISLTILSKVIWNLILLNCSFSFRDFFCNIMQNPLRLWTILQLVYFFRQKNIFKLPPYQDKFKNTYISEERIICWSLFIKIYILEAICFFLSTIIVGKYRIRILHQY